MTPLLPSSQPFPVAQLPGNVLIDLFSHFPNRLLRQLAYSANPEFRYVAARRIWLHVVVETHLGDTGSLSLHHILPRQFFLMVSQQLMPPHRIHHLSIKGSSLENGDPLLLPEVIDWINKNANHVEIKFTILSKDRGSVVNTLRKLALFSHLSLLELEYSRERSWGTEEPPQWDQLELPEVPSLAVAAPGNINQQGNIGELKIPILVTKLQLKYNVTGTGTMPALPAGLQVLCLESFHASTLSRWQRRNNDGTEDGLGDFSLYLDLLPPLLRQVTVKRQELPVFILDTASEVLSALLPNLCTLDLVSEQGGSEKVKETSTCNDGTFVGLWLSSTLIVGERVPIPDSLSLQLHFSLENDKELPGGESMKPKDSVGSQFDLAAVILDLLLVLEKATSLELLLKGLSDLSTVRFPPNLTRLVIKSNNLRLTSFPVGIQNLPGLEELVVRNGNFEVQQALIETLPQQLKVLDLTGCSSNEDRDVVLSDLATVTPAFLLLFARLTRLQKLVLSLCRLPRIHRIEFSPLIKELVLDENRIHGVENAYEFPPELERLLMQSCKLSRFWGCRLPATLVSLDLGTNPLGAPSQPVDLPLLLTHLSLQFCLLDSLVNLRFPHRLLEVDLGSVKCLPLPNDCFPPLLYSLRVDKSITDDDIAALVRRHPLLSIST